MIRMSVTTVTTSLAAKKYCFALLSVYNWRLNFRAVRISPIKKGSLDVKAAAPQEEDERVVFSTFLQVSMSFILVLNPAAPANIA